MKIIHKILNSAAVLAIIPILFCLPMFRFIMTIGLDTGNQLLSLLGNAFNIESIIASATGIDVSKLPETYTIPELYNLIFAEESTFSFAGLDTSALPEEVSTYFTAAAVLFATALVFAVIALFTGLFVKKKLVTASVGALGFISAFSASKCFNHIAQQLVSGKISLVPLIEKLDALKNYSSYVKYIDIDIRILELSSAFTMFLVLLAVIVLLNIGFHLADSVSDV